MDSDFKKNNASEALIYVTTGGALVINNSKFEDNYSVGRGSIIFVDQIKSSASVYFSIFARNYAMRGGVFFA